MNPCHLPAKLFFLCALIFLFGCQKEISFENGNGSGSGGSGGTAGAGGNGNSGGSSNASYYYKATIGGTNYFQDVTPTNDYIAGSGLGGTDDVDFSAGIDPMSPSGKTSFGVTKGLFHNYLSSTNAQFKAFFNPGTYPYTSGPDSDPYKNGDGVYIDWVDKQGNLWSTIDGTGDQTGSTFKIISVGDEPDALNNYYIKVKMQFNCKLYKESTGEMIQLTNGEMVGLFGKI